MGTALATQNQEAAGSRPLRNPAYELYVRERLLMLGPLEACRRVAAEHPENTAVVKAGFATITKANAAKLDRNEKIQERIKWFVSEDEEVRKAKFHELEQFWWTALRTDPAVYWEEGEEEVRNRKGNLVVDHNGQPVMRPYKRLRRFEELSVAERQLIEGLTYTEKGKPNLRLVTKTEANKELRKMLALDKPVVSKVEHSGTVTLEALVMASYVPQESAPLQPDTPKTIEHEAGP